jgi:hypothetical protein
MSAIHLRRPGWAFVFIAIMMCSLVVAVAIRRMHDMNYAASVSAMSYRVCQDLKSIETPVCQTDARRTYDLMDPGTTLAPTILAAALFGIISGLLASAIVVVIRLFRKVSRALNVGPQSHQ